MGILKRLFGKKKKDEPKEEVSVKPKEETQDVTLDDVEKGLKDVDTVKEDKTVENEKPEYKTESEEIPKTEKEEPEEKTDEPAKEQKTSEQHAQTPSQDEPDKHYHIKKHTKGWQVVEEDAKKAYRVFQYQKEAIDFAKSENLSYTIFKADGTPRTE